MRFLFALLLFAFSAEAIEYKPWFERYLEPQLRTSYRLQHYHSIGTPHGKIGYPSYDSILAASLELNPGYPPYENVDGEIGISAARTRKNNFTIEDLFLNLRYRWSDDLVDDPFSLVTGLILMTTCRHALHDPSLFHHGGFEVEAYASIGREAVCRAFWGSRKWAVLGVGIADKGCPWVRANAYWEKNCFDKHILQVFAASLFGLGTNTFAFPFHGYGTIGHRSVDVGLSYAYLLGCYCEGYLSLEYFHRVYARNCPRQLDSIKLAFHYPFCCY